MTIWKFPTTLSDVSGTMIHDMPRGARVLSVVNQSESLTIYAEVDPSAPKVPRRFQVVGTGHIVNLPVNARFVGTALFMSGSFVLHVYDLGGDR